MKKLKALSVLFMLIFCMSFLSAQAENPGVKLKINGEFKNLMAYNIRGNNYFKLRDVANVLNGSDAEFDVIWNESKKAIELLSKTPYSTKEELTNEVIENPVAVSSYVSIYKDGSAVLLGAYNIANNNYFKLRDIANALDFYVGWDSENGIIEIDTSKKYEYPLASTTDFSLNSQYLTFIGKSKAEIDSMIGNGSFSAENGLSVYENGIKIKWNTLNEEPNASSVAEGIHITYDKLFDNCSNVVYESQIKKLFNNSNNFYDETRGQVILSVNYCGKSLEFYPDFEMTKTSYAYIDVNTPYEFCVPETININNQTVYEDLPNRAAFYEFALANEQKFKELNMNVDYRNNGKIYTIADVDHDGANELVVDINFGVAVYKNINGVITEIHFDPCEVSGGSWGYDLIEWNGKYYLRNFGGGGTEEYVLKIVNKRGNIRSSKEWLEGNNTKYYINLNEVSKEEYYNHTGVMKPAGGKLTINDLRP